LLRNPDDPRDFCFVERWEDEKALAQHAETAHLKTARAQAEGLVEIPPDVRRYRIL
jgi:quinol monooxygenase YgiN